jgi:hypothetical protein
MQQPRRRSKGDHGTIKQPNESPSYTASLRGYASGNSGLRSD